MQVSAVNLNNNGYTMSNSAAATNNRAIDTKVDTSFNSLTPYISRKMATSERLPIVFDSVNQWKKFCQQRILGGKLDVIA